MNVITLTTDLGHKDFYVASIKGKILSELNNVSIVDVSNEIPIFDINFAAFTLKNCCFDFPEGTVHIVSIDAEISANKIPLLIKHKGHYFIGADNGLFSLLFDQTPSEIFELTINHDSDILTFPTKNIFVKAACHIARGGTPEIIGRRIDEIKTYQNFRATTTTDTIRGSIIYRDSYGNAISNISLRLFNEIGKGRQCIVRFKNYEIKNISKTYSEVPNGEKIALFNSAENLEIAINRGVLGAGGSATQLLGLNINEVILIEFIQEL
jgi:S-adenosylmethionine hydrolase